MRRPRRRVIATSASLPSSSPSKRLTPRFSQAGGGGSVRVIVVPLSKIIIPIGGARGAYKRHESGRSAAPEGYLSSL